MYVPQVMPISTLQRTYKAVVSNLIKGPIFLAQYSKPIAVMMSTSDYERLAGMEAEVKRLQRIVLADQDFAEMRQGRYVEG